MNLAAIIEEGEQAEQSYRDAKPFTAAEIGAGDWCHRFYVQHGPTLLAVAKAAVECADDGCGCVREVPDPDGVGVRINWCSDNWPDKPENWCWSCRMRAAVRGEGKEKTNG